MGTVLARWSFCALVLFVIGCGRKSQSSPEPSVAATTEMPTAAPAAVASAPTFNAVQQALKSGAYDNAAAQLLEMRARGKQFSEEEAAVYRRSLNDAYLQALEAAQKGDPRAKAAIEMIRANSGG